MIRSARKRIDFKSATFCFQLFSQTAFFSPRRNVRKRIPRSLRGRLFFTASSSGCEWYCLPVASQHHVDGRSVDVAILRQITIREDVFGNGFRAGVGAHLSAIGVPMVLHALLHAGHADGGPHLCVYVCVCVCVRGSGSPWPIKVRPRVGPSLPRQLGAARIPFGGPPDHGQEVHQAADVRQPIGHTATTPQAPVDLPLGPLV